MAYRNGTYIAFHTQGTNQPGKSDMDYYNLMRAWSAKLGDDFTMVNSHDKASSVRDSSKKATLQASIQERLRNSKNMVLIIGKTTKFDTDWVPFEIEQSIDVYNIPIIATYTNCNPILDPLKLRSLWPRALKKRIDDQTAHVIHIPFKKYPILAAINEFDSNNHPNSSLVYYSRKAYESWGLL